MSQTFWNRQGLLSVDSPGSALDRLAELAADFGAEHVAATARATAERVSAGLFYVACVGQFKRGKSTLLNALIGQSVLPTAVVPVTTVPTIIRHGKVFSARVRFESSEWVDVPVNSVEDYVSEKMNPENAKRVAEVEILVPSSLLKGGMCFVDTPGLGSVFAGNTAATHAFVPHIDAAIVVIGADPPLTWDELQFVKIVADQVHDLLFVLNKADRLSELERAAAIEFAQNVLARHLKRDMPRIFEVSALESLGGCGPTRDWPLLVQALESLVLSSGSSLAREAAERGIRRATQQLVAVIREERETLLRPLEDSERRISKLRNTMQEAEGAICDLGVLFSAEQQRLSKTFEGRRTLFLKEAQASASKALSERLPSLAGRNGPAHRRDVNHLAQDIAREQLTPWLEGEARFAEEEFRRIARRFVEHANDFLGSLSKSGIIGLEELPEEIGFEQGLRIRSQFHFHFIERVASPASPLLLVSDFVMSAIGMKQGIARGGQEFLAQLLEVNSARVQSDVDERVRESRKVLEAELKATLLHAISVSEQSLSRARAVHAAGTQAVKAAIARLESAEREIGSRADLTES